MIHYSKIHNWQGDAAVKQILVFASVHDLQRFENAFDISGQNEDFNDAEFNPVFKLRAVKTNNGTYVPLIRNANGVFIWEGGTNYTSFEYALLEAHQMMNRMLSVIPEELIGL